jgi:Fic family protein
MIQLETLLKRVDSLKAEWDAARPIPASLLEQLRTDWEVLLTYHSNAIEGSTLTLGETKAILLDGITIGGKPLREHLEAINHREAMRLMTRLAQSGTPLLETELLELHRTILTGIQSEDAGVYRTVRVRVAGSMRIFPNPVKVPELMGAFVKDVNVMQSHPVVTAARAHYGLVAIHPFADGNGRTARLLMNLLLLRHTFPPVLVPIELRARYYDALEAANNGDLEPFDALMTSVVIAALERVLEVVGGD